MLGKRKVLLLIFCLTLLCVFPFNAKATDYAWTVNSTGDDIDADTTDSDCETSTAGECTLRAAIQQSNASAASGDTVTITFSEASTICLSKDLTISNANLTLTIIGDDDGTVLDGGNAPSSTGTSCTASGTVLFYISSATSLAFENLVLQGGDAPASGGAILNFATLGTFTISGSTIQYNTANSATSEANGGAVYSYSKITNFNISDTVFSNNTATSSYSHAYGGALHLRSCGALSLDGVTFSENVAETTAPSIFPYNGWGGALYLPASCSVTVNNSSFNGNYAKGTSGQAAGGAFYVNSSSSGVSDVTITASTFEGNYAQATTGKANGGSIYLYESAQGTISESVFDSNHSTSTGNYSSGGAIYVDRGGSLSAEDTKFYSNSAESESGKFPVYGGALRMKQDSTLNLTRVSITNNSATSAGFEAYGGGLACASGVTATLVNATVSENTAIVTGAASNGSYGGGIRMIGVPTSPSTLTIHSSTIVNNASTASAATNAYSGGLEISAYTTTNIKNTVLAGNTVSGMTNSIGPNCYGTLTSFDYNVVPQDTDADGDGTVDCNLVGMGNDYTTYSYSDLGLDALADNGGSAYTHSIGLTSPLYNTGNGSPIGSGVTVTTDGRNYVRDADVDRGAFEYVSEADACTDGIDNDGDGYIDAEDADCAVCGDTILAESEVCDDGNTADGDGCSATCTTEIITATETICDNGIDDDSDGPIDCDDSDCASDPVCAPVVVTTEVGYCDDEIDNDSDGPIDCDDSDCTSDPACAPVVVTTEVGYCDDEIDNDSDGPIDCDDSDCTSDPACAPVVVTTEVGLCDDEFDNDSDGDIDCDDTIDCASDPVCAPVVVTTEAGYCDDEIDNDNDDDVDCEDADCESDPVCEVVGPGLSGPPDDPVVNARLSGSSILDCTCSLTMARPAKGFGLIYLLASVSLIGLIFWRRQANQIH